MDVKEKIRRYWDLSHDNYDKSPGHGLRSNQEKNVWTKALERNLKLDKNSKILDVGTGTGFLALLLAELGYKVVGIDLSEKMMSKAIEKAESNGFDIKFQLGGAENTQFEDECFDAVISRHLLWTLPNPKRAIEEWHRILKPAGKIIIIDGKWSSDDINSKLRRFIGYSLGFIMERKNPFDWGKHYEELRDRLPFYNGALPSKVESLLYETGFSGVWQDSLSDVIEVEKKHAPIHYRLMYANKNSKYLIGGKKKNETKN